MLEKNFKPKTFFNSILFKWQFLFKRNMHHEKNRKFYYCEHQSKIKFKTGSGGTRL